MTSWPKLDDKLLADSAATFNWRLGTPTPLAVTRDGAVLFRRTPPRAFTSDLYELSQTGALRRTCSAPARSTCPTPRRRAASARGPPPAAWSTSTCPTTARP
jgi:hypothetical protein